MMQFLETLKLRNEPLYWFGLLCMASALLCLALVRWYPVQVAGVNAWYKPFKFFLSTAVFVWSMAWYMGYLDARNAIWYYSWALIVLFTFEDVYIMAQAARGQLSHFNVQTPVYRFLYGLMALASAAISIWTAVIGWKFFSQSFPELPAAYVWGIRLGLVLFVFFSLQGFSMGARLAHTVGAPDGAGGWPVVNWSKQYGDLRVAHFLGMHALQVLPLLSWFVLKNVRLVWLAALLWAVMTSWMFWRALQAKPVWISSAQHHIQSAHHDNN
jgi:hypothetical protein